MDCEKGRMIFVSKKAQEQLKTVNDASKEMIFDFVEKQSKKLEIEMCLETLDKEGLLQEFSKYFYENCERDFLELIKEFVKKHPDKFMVTE
jgi:hypothetical protein